MKTQNTYQIVGKVTVSVVLDINAESLTDAIEKARQLKPTDFVKIKGEYSDGAYQLEGVWAKENKGMEIIESGCGIE